MNLEKFLKELEEFTKYFSPEALEFYNKLKNEGVKTSKGITENGLKILTTMKDNKDQYSNIFTSKQIGEILFMSPRSVSGSIKKLITDGYVVKKSLSPVTYALTDLGIEFTIDNK